MTDKKTGRPKIDGDLVRARIERAELDALDTFAADPDLHGDGAIGRPEAVRRILRDWLIGHGYLRG